VNESPEPTGLPHPDFTPEQKAAIYAKYKKLFSVEDLIGYIEDDGPGIPAREFLGQMRERVRILKTQTKEAN